MKILKIKIMLVIGITMLIGILMPNKSYGALQSNGGTPATKDINGWITQIRQMQATGGSLGLTDTINGTNLTSGNKNLDIHMEKNTEYGAVILLGASSYGNPNKMNTNGVTTTGNQTGVVMNINKEWVAAGMSNTGAASMKNAANRYKNQYTAPNYTEKIGDAVATAGGWHGSTQNTWLSTNYNNEPTIIRCCLLRAYSGSVFSYYGYGYHNASSSNDVAGQRRDADYRKTWASRAVVVTGSGV